MAAGSEVPQKGVLQASGYTPVETRLNPPIQLPGTGELWAGVGKTALAAAGQLQSTAQMIQQSPLNPAIRSQMYEAQGRADLGRDYTNFVRQNPNWEHAVTAEGPGGATTTAPITQPVTQQNAWDLDYSGGAPSKPATTEEKKEEPPQEKKAPPEPPKDLNKGLSQTSNVSPALMAGGSDEQALAGARAGDSGSGAAQEGTPASMTFLNPATGNIEPLQTGSVFAAKPAAPAPAAPTGPPAQPAQGGSPAAATQADQVAMQKWQNQNAHPVMSSQDALSWMKNFDTGVQRATYLPMGGPGGSPAFAFHMKNNGINTVPVSQMVGQGAGPLVAGQNTSQVLSATDQAQQGGPGAQGQPPAPQDQTQVATPPNISPPAPPNLPQMQPTGQVSPGPTGTAAQPWGPPAAPSGPPRPNMLTDAAPYPTLPGMQAQWNNQLLTQPMPTANGQPPAAPTGPRLIPAQAVTTQPVTTQPVLSHPATAQEVKDLNLPSSTTMEADAAKPVDNRVYKWKTGTDAQGNAVTYADLPDPGGHPFITQRYYKGNLSGFQIGPQTPENLQKQQLYDELMGPKGTPLPADTHITEDDIRNSTPEWREHWLRYIRDMDNHRNAPTATSDEGQNLSNARMSVQDSQRIVDRLLWMQAHHIPISTISHDEIIRSQEAGYAAGANNPIEKAIWNSVSGGFPFGEAQPKNDLVNAMNADYIKLNDHLAHVRGGTYEHAAGTPKAEVWGIPATDWTPPGGIPKSTNVSKGILALNQIGTGDTIEKAIADAQEVLANAVKDYKGAADKIRPANMRLSDEDQKAMSDLMNPKKGYIDDTNNKVWDEKHEKMVNPYGPIPYKPNPYLAHWDMLGDDGKPIQSTTASATSSPTPSATPMVRVQSPQDVEDFKKKYGKGVPFMGRDRNGNWVQMAF